VFLVTRSRTVESTVISKNSNFFAFLHSFLVGLVAVHLHTLFQSEAFANELKSRFSSLSLIIPFGRFDILSLLPHLFLEKLSPLLICRNLATLKIGK